MTDTEAALAYLREQFGEGWECGLYAPGDDDSGGISDHGAAQSGWWLAEAEHGPLSLIVYGPDPMSAARACVEAWREATKERERLSFKDGWQSAMDNEVQAEREHADRLAESLRFAYKHVAKCDCVVCEQLAAHAARRAGEGA